MPLFKQLIVFGLIGSLGFLVDTAVLYLLVFGGGAGLLEARIGSFLAAATFTWWGNRTFTFRQRQSQRKMTEWSRFLAVNSIGAVANYGTYAALVTHQTLFADHPVLAVAAGSIAGLGFNYCGSRFLVFRVTDTAAQASPERG